MKQEENQFMLQDGEIDNRQFAGKHSNSLYMNAQKQYYLGKADIKTDVITEINRAQNSV